MASTRGESLADLGRQQTRYLGISTASPGRFFVANELKAMLAYIVLNYDIKLPGDGSRPENVCFGLNIIPDPRAQILFRKRQCAT